MGNTKTLYFLTECESLIDKMDCHPIDLTQSLEMNRRHSPTAKNVSPNGQSMLEVAVALPFLLLIVIALIEMGIVFASYLSLVNAAREGAIFASMCPVLTDSTKDVYSPIPTSPIQCLPGSTISNIEEYRNRVNDEIVTSIGQVLVAGQIQIEDSACNTGTSGVGVYIRCLKVDRPVKDTTCTGIGCPITVTVHYRLHTFSSDMSLPVPRVNSAVSAMPSFGASSATWTNWFFSVMAHVDWSTGWRMGLPNYYEIVYSVGMPIR